MILITLTTPIPSTRYIKVTMTLYNFAPQNAAPPRWVKVIIDYNKSLLALGAYNNRFSQLQEIRIQAEQTVNAGNWLYLDASQLLAKMDGFSYKWRQAAGKKVLINKSDSIRAWVQTQSNITRYETLEFELVVTDNKGIDVVVTHTVFVTALWIQ